MTKTKYAVLGAGCGGQTFAGHLASQGFDINLYNRSRERLGNLPNDPTISLEGAITGGGKINLVTTNIGEAVKDTDVILVATTALGHGDIARSVAPYLQNGQVLILNPSRTFGSLEVANEIYTQRPNLDVTICEANTLLYATRVPEPGKARVFGVKEEVTIAAIRPDQTRYALDKINEAFPQMKAAENILETSLGNIGAVFHPSIFLANYDRITRGDKFEFYREGVTDEAAALMKNVDSERQAIAQELGTSIPTLEEWLTSRYGLKGNNLQDLLHNNPVYAGIFAPTEVQHRYLLEDVPTGLVPLALVGEALGVQTPTMNYLIDKSEEATGQPLRDNGRTLQKLGLTRSHLRGQLQGIMYQQPEARYA